ncbi:formimidoylglutamate deiminase [Natronospira proteinivora]|uniref:Formimidoylglutamate deiminase n=1 Tax=Natronospira proteinivora TaxID=1807133 RepID=A0ABT1G778_9GAMM|nr:formimidoylglutamate deiminase [Natronospira proteinivora]MCP1727155.1 formimidoylglutamate deiminase [Natronospira proteinivora]
MTQRLTFRHILTPQGMLNDCAVVVSSSGRIQAIDQLDASRKTLDYDGWLALPGIPNAHSHAFQRAMSGFGEKPAGEDSFWSWRDHMYRLAAAVTPEQMRIIAEWVFSEMLLGGFTRVAEFHYLHHDPTGARGPEMARAVAEAAATVGIDLKLLPVYYQTGGFDQAPGEGQKRFVHRNVEEFMGLLEQLADLAPGVAPHSLRAVPPELLKDLVSASRQALGPDIPIHIHVAEQRKEVMDCQARHGRAPLTVLADHVELDAHWNLVHATHAGPDELRRIHERGARVVICPLTEAYLGDGFFPAVEYLRLGGGLAIGSDSNCRVDAVEELRLLEYGQRLRRERRLLLADDSGIGAALWQMAATAGARALGEDPAGEDEFAGAIQPGARADLVVLDPDSPALAGHGSETALDALLIGGNRDAIADVYVAGRRHVQAGSMEGVEERRRAFAQVVRSIYQ